MFRLIKCKAIPEDSVGIMLDDETEYDQCPMDEALQQQLRFAHIHKGNEGVNNFYTANHHFKTSTIFHPFIMRILNDDPSL